MLENVTPPFPAPPGFRWLFFKCFRHYITGKLVYRKNGGSFRILVRM
jgi:hypothetical protein